jgi:hypothetical protein
MVGFGYSFLCHLFHTHLAGLAWLGLDSTTDRHFLSHCHPWHQAGLIWLGLDSTTDRHFLYHHHHLAGTFDLVRRGFGF